MKQLLTTATASALILWVIAGSAFAGTKKAKVRHWSGNLVDVSCIARFLATHNPMGAVGMPGASPFAGANAYQAGAAGAGQAGPGGVGGGTPPPTPTMPQGPMGQGPGMSPQEQEQQARANAINHAEKECVATPSTQAFGLAMSGGRVLRLDPSGNEKVLDALKRVEVKPGKKVKAKVTGTKEGATTVNVSSVQVKGKRLTSASASS